jgi:hypothetical protein
MTTPLKERILKKARESANEPMTPTGATAAMSKQAAVSATGKAAAPGTGLAQSAVGETMAAEQAANQQEAVAQQVQSAGEELGVKEKAADVKQSQVESDLAMKKLKADNDFVNQMLEFDSRINMSRTAKEQDMALLEMKSQLQSKRLSNAEYKQSLQDIGRKKRLQSKEDFAIALSEQGLERGKLAGDDERRMKRYTEDYRRESQGKISMDEIDSALKKSVSDSKASVTKAGIEAASGVAQAGVSYGMDQYAASQQQEKDLKYARAYKDKKGYERKHGVGSFEKDEAAWKAGAEGPSDSDVSSLKAAARRK